jgi:hypothetical protein
MGGVAMNTLEKYDDYMAELRAEVCSRCIEREPGSPPCAPHGKGCGIEQHVPQLVGLCRETVSSQMDPYIEELHDKICTTCPNKDQPSCPCPLDYLLKLAVDAIETVERRRAAGGVVSCEPPTEATLASRGN